MFSLRPRRIIVDDREQALLIEWSDSHESQYSLDGLRRTCPCASCSGGHDNMGTLPDPMLYKVPALMQWHNIRIESVGTYAIRIDWEDGHNAGIYTFERLRSTCPCDLCLSN